MRFKLTLLVILLLVAVSLPAPATPSSANTSVAVGVYCLYLGRHRNECHAVVDGGTAPYTYQWSPTPLAGGFGEGIAIIGCPGTSVRTISVTVTDANGNTGSFSDQFQCCGTCDPQ